MKQGNLLNFFGSKNSLKTEGTTNSQKSNGTIDIINNKDNKSDKESNESKNVQIAENINKNIHGSTLKRTIIDDLESDASINNKMPKIDLNTKKSPNKIIVNNNVQQLNSKLAPEGESLKFLYLADKLNKIEQIKGENSKDLIKNIFSNLFVKIILNTNKDSTELVKPDNKENVKMNDLIRCYNFLLSKLGPEYRTPELGIGNELLVKCVASSTGRSDKQVKQRIVELGDLALVAAEGKKGLGTMEKFSGFGLVSNTKKELNLKQVMDTFVNLSKMTGKSSVDTKLNSLIKLLTNAANDEIKYIIRSLQRSLKIGASFKTIIAALGRAIFRIYTNTYSLNGKKYK